MQSRVWIRCLAWWGSPSVAWERQHQEHAFAFWSPSNDQELIDLRREVADEHRKAEAIEPGYSSVCDFNLKSIRVAWAT